MDTLKTVLDAVVRLGKPAFHLCDDATWYVQLSLYSNSPNASVIMTNTRPGERTNDLQTELEFVLAEAVRTIHTFEFGKPKPI